MWKTVAQLCGILSFVLALAIPAWAVTIATPTENSKFKKSSNVGGSGSSSLGQGGAVTIRFLQGGEAVHSDLAIVGWGSFWNEITEPPGGAWPIGATTYEASRSGEATATVDIEFVT